MFDFEEMWAITDNGGAGGKEYVQNGLIFLDNNFAPDTEGKASFVRTTGIVTNFNFKTHTAEIFCNVDSFTRNVGALIKLGTYARYDISVRSPLGDGSDYRLALSDSSYYPTPKDGLKYGDWHTFSFVGTENGVLVYYDGEYDDTFAEEKTFDTQSPISQIDIGYSTTNGSITIDTFKWGSVRLYNRALTAAEIAQNRAVDEQLMANWT